MRFGKCTNCKEYVLLENAPYCSGCVYNIKYIHNGVCKLENKLVIDNITELEKQIDFWSNNQYNEYINTVKNNKNDNIIKIRLFDISMNDEFIGKQHNIDKFCNKLNESLVSYIEDNNNKNIIIDNI